ncbi:MAG: cation:proton antiporter [Candidatus Omnitrophica bacterium]|nr:cation:proton antiporter [Candidatus Omnitrophota bacterium]
MNVLLVVGIVILLGAAGGRIFQKLRMPAIMGYIIIGILLGESLHGILSGPVLNSFVPIINLSLGIIGFMIGSELNFERFRRYSRSIYTILFCETVLTFLGVAAVVTFFTKELYMGLILGALASATAPAATYSVLGEYKARGPLTMTTLSIVALDDGLALIIYGLASAFARSFMAHENISLLSVLGAPLLGIGGAIVIGLTAAFVLHGMVIRATDAERFLPFTLGTILFVVGLSIFFKVDFIFASMVLGAMVSNLQSSDNREMFNVIKKFSPPIYILFFVLVGARLDARILLRGGVPFLALAYIASRSAGKMTGAYIGGRLSKAKETVTKYLGFCLFDQAGIAVGLAIAAYNTFSGMGYEKEGLLIINIITATTFLLQFLAPPMIKYGIKKADELNRNVTEEDIIGTYRVRDVMDEEVILIKANNNLRQILNSMKGSAGYTFPIVGMDGKFAGVTSLGEIRDTFYEEQMDQLILAGDILRETTAVAYADQKLQTAIEIFKSRKVDYLPVLDSEGSQRVVGQVEYRKLMDRMDKEVLLRQQELEA